MHVSIHCETEPFEDRLLGLVVMRVDELRAKVPVMLTHKMRSRAVVLVRVETVRVMRVNEAFTIAATAS